MRIQVLSGGQSRTAVLLGAVILLTACGSSRQAVLIQVNPPEASVYIDGKPAGKGDLRPHDLDLGGQSRIFIQATAHGFKPRLDVLTPQAIQLMVDHKEPIRLTLAPQN